MISILNCDKNIEIAELKQAKKKNRAFKQDNQARKHPGTPIQFSLSLEEHVS